MSNSENQWNIQTVPQSFWDRIESAGRDAGKFEEGLMGLSERDLRELVAQYDGLSQALIVSGYQRFPEEVQEEPPERLKEIANWVITQGRTYYEDILAHPEKFPKRNEVRRPIFAGSIIDVYARKFGPWRDEE
jgi:hypothetical protein